MTTYKLKRNIVGIRAEITQMNVNGNRKARPVRFGDDREKILNLMGK